MAELFPFFIGVCCAGIGTDATHAEHIETVKSREYVFTEDRDKLVPGRLAMALVEGYDAMGFAMSKPHLRAGLETDLVKICDGAKSKGDVLQVRILILTLILVLTLT